MTLPLIAEDTALLAQAATEASDIAMHYFRRASLRVDLKENNSPVSEGDYAVDKYLRETLTHARPAYGWLSEETADDDPSSRMGAARTFIVDPIDGTRAYISGRDTWCISMAIVEDGRPVAGLLACPALGESICASIVDEQRVLTDDDVRPIIVGGRKAHVRDLAKRLPTVAIKEGHHVPSLAYRIAMVADGRLAGTFIRKHAHEWDVAAADVIATMAGACFVDADGEQIIYNQRAPTLGEMVCAKPALIGPMLNVVTANSIR
ncbi:MAG: 3'(2'),5'-bisphosphate nucleotidase CysQ [Pseudomonadota bacterium]